MGEIFADRRSSSSRKHIDISEFVAQEKSAITGPGGNLDSARRLIATREDT
jgi:hypothetical protein